VIILIISSEEEDTVKLLEVMNYVAENSNCMPFATVITWINNTRRSKELKVDEAPGVDEIVLRLLFENAECLNEP
jgi:hypothetical protein